MDTMPLAVLDHLYVGVLTPSNQLATVRGLVLRGRRQLVVRADGRWHSADRVVYQRAF